MLKISDPELKQKGYKENPTTHNDNGHSLGLFFYPHSRMTTPAADPTAAMTDIPTPASTGPAVHDLSYLLDVLNIGDGETEEQLDERLRQEAQELGIELNPHPKADNRLSAFQTGPLDFHRRPSIGSRASVSTGLTSTYSDFSRDHSSAGSASFRRQSRTSLSFRDYDAFLARGVPHGRNSISFSPRTTPDPSVFSLPLSEPPTSPDAVESPPKKHFKRLRGLSMLRLHRIASVSAIADDAGCPHCPVDAASSGRATRATASQLHRLPCGHRLCTDALRQTIKTATASPRGAVPSCCGTPIPGSLVEHVMTTDEQHELLAKLEEWDEAASLAPRDSMCMPSESVATLTAAQSATDQRPSFSTATTATQSSQHDLLTRVLTHPTYLTLLQAQRSQAARFQSWAHTRRSAVLASHTAPRAALNAHHQQARELLFETHAAALCDAEDKQVSAEAALLDVQARERRDAATALRHIEAFCAGALATTGEPHGRPVTEQDLATLAAARREAEEVVPRRQKAAVEVLRGEQARRLRRRQERQEGVERELERSQRRAELEFERKCKREVAEVEQVVEEKARRLRWRWEVQVAVAAKAIVGELGGGEAESAEVVGRLPTAELDLRVREEDVVAGMELAHMEEDFVIPPSAKDKRKVESFSSVRTGPPAATAGMDLASLAGPSGLHMRFPG